MKILKPGRQGTDVLRGECNNCGCRVECATSEARTIQDGYSNRWVPCPNCYLNLYVFTPVPDNLMPPQGGTGAVSPKRNSD